MEKPKYVQIYESLVEEIETGRLKPGDRLPSERELSQQLGVSRMTVRQAVDTLANQGFVTRSHGSGTFVTEFKIDQEAGFLIGFHEAMIELGHKPGAKLLTFERQLANQKLAGLLKVDIGRPLYYIQRLRTVNEKPHALENTYLPEEFFPGIDEFDLIERSIYNIMEEEYGLQLDKAEQTWEPIIANEYVSEVLSVSIGAPLMLVHRISYRQDGQPVEYAKDIFRGDRSRFVSRSVYRK